MMTPAYDPIAELYDRAFADIRVREPEWRWLTRRLAALPAAPRVLDIGCGNGALLRALASRISLGEGVDVSEAMLARARAHGSVHKHLSFQPITGTELPFANNSF